MRISYDPEKNQRNIVERGLSFDEVANLDWNAAFILKDDRRDYGEDRYRVLGKIGEELYAVVFTWREEEIRVISFRRANRREEILYDQRQANERGRREPGVDRGGDAPG